MLVKICLFAIMDGMDTVGNILRSEFSQIDDNIYQYIEGNSFKLNYSPSLAG